MTDKIKPFRVFVYGTLKKGYGNHRLLDKPTVKKVGDFFTLEKYGLSYAGFPYMIDREYQDKHQVLGEVYESDDLSVLQSLDFLEGVSHGHYRRDTVEVVSLETGETEAVESYIAETTRAELCPPCDTTEIDNKTFFEWA